MATTQENPVQQTKVVTDKVRASYAHVFHPTSMSGNDKDAKYGISLIISKSNKALIDRIEKAIVNAIQVAKPKLFEGKDPKSIPNFKWPLRDGDKERPDDEAYKNAYFVNASCKTKPEVVDQTKNPIIDETEFYSGCYCRASVNFYGFNKSGSKGIACGLNNLQKLADGEPLGGRVSANIDFADDYDASGDDDLI